MKTKKRKTRWPSLSHKQHRFVRHMISHFDAVEAAVRAGYSRRYAREQSWSLFATPHIQEAFSAEWRKLERMTKIARASIADYMDITPDGSPMINLEKALKGQAEGLLTVTCEYSMKQRGDQRLPANNLSLTMGDKIGALEYIMDYWKSVLSMDERLAGTDEENMERRGEQVQPVKRFPLTIGDKSMQSYE